jgi:hypothetical protein
MAKEVIANAKATDKINLQMGEIQNFILKSNLNLEDNIINFA